MAPLSKTALATTLQHRNPQSANQAQSAIRNPQSGVDARKQICQHQTQISQQNPL
jgi:hypothetical protein